MLKRDPILISLSPSSLRIGVLARGEIARVERVMLEGFNADEVWAAGLRPIDDLLRKALGSLRIVAGTPARIVYASPRTMAEVFVAPATGAAAVEAARMHLRQSLADGGAGWSTTVQSLMSVRDGAAARRQLMLLTADLNQHLNTLGEWGARCGLNVQSVAPAKGVLLEHAVQSVPETGTPQARIFLNEHTMTLCGWSGGQLSFARCADVGYALLADALYRAARAHTGEDLSRDYATRLLFALGMPARGQVLDQAKNLPAEAVLPLTQPALQRCVIEIRQTLRFGFTEQDLARAAVWLGGPGTAIPGVADAISAHLEMAIDIAERKKGGPANGVAEDQVGDLAIAAAQRDSSLWTVPPRRLERTRARSVTVAVRAGAVVGLLTLGALWGRTQRARAQVANETAELAPHAALIGQTAAQRDQNERDEARLARVAEMLDAGLGRRTSWLAALALPPQGPDAAIHILGVEGLASKDSGVAPSLTITGRVKEDAVGRDKDGADPVSQFVQLLTSSPIVSGARVVSASAGEGGIGGQFVIEVQLKHVPASLEVLSSAALPAGGKS